MPVNKALDNSESHVGNLDFRLSEGFHRFYERGEPSIYISPPFKKGDAGGFYEKLL
jgi:hypothetical protein